MGSIRFGGSEGKMLGSAPKFPAFETWRSMSENEQDALLAKMERTRRRRSMLFLSCLAVASTIVAAGIGSALYAALVVGP